MKKLLVMLVVMAIAAPVFAADVDFAATDNGDGTATITYTVNAGTIRGMALNVDADAAVEAVAVDSFFDVFMDAAYMDPANYALGDGTPVAAQDAAGEVGLSANFCLSMGNLEGVATADEIVITAPDQTTVTLDINPLRGGVVNTDGAAMTTNLPISILITSGVCPCKGDIADSTSIGAPDGQVDTGDLLAMVGRLSAVGIPYIITPVPADLDCVNVADSTSIGAPDDKVDTGDLLNIINYLSAIGTPYVGPCMP